MPKTHAQDARADGALFGRPIAEDAVEGAPPRLAHALTGKRPDDAVGADGNHILQAQAMERIRELPTLAIHTVGEHHAEVKARCDELVDHLHGQLRLALIDIARFKPARRLEEAEGKRKGHVSSTP